MEPNIDNSLNAGVSAAHGQPNIGAPAMQSRVAATYQGPALTSAGAPQQASDADLIEEAWIDAARHAVAANSGDPHAMSDAVAALRQEYLQRRYGKSVETDK